MNEKFIVEDVTEVSDVKIIHELYQSLVGTPGCTWSEFYPTYEDVLFDFRQGHLFCVRENGVIIAAAALAYEEDLFEYDFWVNCGTNNPELARVAVRGDNQGRGIGAALVRFLLRKIRSLGADSAYLLVSPQNPHAMAMYLHAGFTERGRTHLYERDWLCYERVLDDI